MKQWIRANEMAYLEWQERILRKWEDRVRVRTHTREWNVVVNDNETTKHTERQNYRFDNNGQWWINERTERDENSSNGTKQKIETSKKDTKL